MRLDEYVHQEGYTESRSKAQDIILAGCVFVNGVKVTSKAQKIKDTDTQASLTLAERRKNLKESFKVVDKYAVRGKKILLIDDVMTTGSTLKECALEIRKAGAASVDTLTVARVC